MKKETKKKENMPEQFPIVKDGKFVCSDGAEYTDGFYARAHEKELSARAEQAKSIDN